MIAERKENLTRVIEDMPAEEYHAHSAHGASMLEDFRASRRGFHSLHVTGEQPRKEPSEAMIDGTLIHCLLFEPEKYDDLLAPLPEPLAPDGKKWLRRKESNHERWWKEYLDTSQGKYVVDESRRQRIENTVAAIMANERAGSLLSQEGAPEYSIFWTDEATGLECKCRVDYFAAGISVDLKTSRDPMPQAYARSIVDLGYHRKLAHYCAGLRSLTGKTCPLVHIAAGTSSPHLIACYDIDDTDRRGNRLGERQRRTTLLELTECYRTRDWRESCEKKITKLRLPGWAFSQDDYQLTGE